MNVLGIDIGQNHTKAVLISGGQILQGFQGPSCFTEYGDPKKDIFQALNTTLGTLNHKVSMIGVGMTGFDLPGYAEAVRDYLVHYVTDGDITIVHDGKTAQLGAFGGQDGLVVIAGTGVIGWGAIGNHHEKVGGHGFLVGDEGSGVWIAKEALRRALRAQDFMDRGTNLGMLLCQHFDQLSLEDVNRFVRHQPQLLASFVPYLVQYADMTAKQILVEAAHHLADTMIGLYRKLDCPVHVKAVLTGGIANIQTVYQNYKMCMEETTPKIEIARPLADSSIGATYLYPEAAGWVRTL